MFSQLADKVAFVNYIPLLTQATTDDTEPTPGYLLGEIKNITFYSESSSQQLFEYVIHRLNKSSTFVKIKVLKIIIFLIHNGHVSFRQHLRQCEGPIKTAVLHYGPPDPLLGNTPYKEVQKLAQEVLDLIFDPEIIKEEEKAGATGLVSLETPFFMGGMGASARAGGKYEGFGNTQKEKEGTVTDKMLDYFGRLIHPSEEQTSEVIRAALHSSPGDYQPVSVVSALIEPPISSEPAVAKLPSAKSHTPGRAGGGWESDEDVMEQNGRSDPPVTCLSSTNVPVDVHYHHQKEKPLEDSSGLKYESLVLKFCEGSGLPSIDELDETCLLCSQDECLSFLQAVTSICVKSLRDSNDNCLMRVMLLLEWIYNSHCSTGPALNECSSSALKEILSHDILSQALRSKAKKLSLIFSKLLPNTV